MVKADDAVFLVFPDNLIRMHLGRQNNQVSALEGDSYGCECQKQKKTNL